ncbi:MAG: PAP2 family protein [Bacteroidia bacterium]|nr:PAP2 family protein [Bacteroidia bacterium]
MQNIFAKIISWLFHPLLMPTLGLVVLFNTGTYLGYLPFEYKKYLYLILFLTTGILPLIIIPVFIYRKFIRSLDMHNNNERIFPMIITLIFNGFAYYIFLKLPLPVLIKHYVFAVALCVCLALIITTKWKISTHMIGIGGVVGVIVSLSVLYMINLQWLLILSILSAGLIAFARLQLNAHSPAQVYTGFGLGFLAEFITLVLFS